MTDYTALMNIEAQQNAIDPRLLKAVIQTESSGNPNAYNTSSGAAGLGQLIPSTATSLGVTNPYDPMQAIPASARLLAEDMHRYGTPDQAVAAYHGGTNPANWGLKTQAYVQKVAQDFKNQPMPQPNDPLDQMLATKANGASNVSPQAQVGSDDPIDQMLAAKASGQAPASPTSVASSNPWMTDDIAGQEKAVEAQMSPVDAAKARATFQGLQAIPGDYAWPQAGQSWLHKQAAGAIQGIGDIGMTLGKGIRLVGAGLGLESPEDLGAYMRGTAAEEKAYDQARQVAASYGPQGMDGGQQSSSGIDWGRIAGQLAGGGGLEGGVEDLGALGARSLERLGYRPMVSVPTQAASRLATAATNIAKGAGAAAATSSQSDAGLGTQSLVGGAAGLILPPVLSRTVAPVAGATGNAINRLLGKVPTQMAADASASQASQVAEQASSPIMNAVKTDAQGKISIDTNQLPDPVKQLLTTGPLKNLPPDQQARALTFEALGIKNYTLADLTRNYADAANERNLAQNIKIGAPLREADLAKNEQLLNAAGNASNQMGAQPSDAYEIGSAIRQHLQGQLGAFNQRINQAYQAADQAALNAPKVNMDPVVQALQANRSQFLARGDGLSLLNGIRGRLQEFNGGAPTKPGQPLMVDPSGTPLLTDQDIPKGLTFSDSERFRQFLNDVSTPDNYPLISKLKSAVDQAQDNAGSGKIYEEARALRQQRSAMFENQNGIANILANKPGGDPTMPVDALMNRYVFNKGNADQLSQLVNQLNIGGNEGQAILNRLRSTVVQNAVQNATSRVPGEKGAGAFSGTGFAQQLDKIGNKKMNVLFTPEQQNYLGALRRGSLDLTTSPPVRNAYNPSGTSAQGINMLDQLASMPNPPGWLKQAIGWGVGKIPVVGEYAKELGAQAQDRATQSAQGKQANLAASPLNALSQANQKPAKDAIKQAIARRLMQQSAIAGGAVQPAGGQ